MNEARVLMEVRAGLIPDVPMDELTKQYVITSEEWNDENTDQTELLAEVNGKMMGYASLLMLQPNQINWVTTAWIWL